MSDLTEEQKKELSEIKEVLEEHHHDGVSVVSGFVSKDCGCYKKSALYKTIVVGLPSGSLYPSSLPGHIHHAIPCVNQRCAKDKRECLKTHEACVDEVNKLLHQLMESKYPRRNKHHQGGD